MKILCVCSKGNCRSVCTRRSLFELHKGHEAIACGLDLNSKETIKMLSEWADKILIADVDLKTRFPKEFEDKVDWRFEIGRDVWDDPWHPELRAKVFRLLEDLGYDRG